MLKKILSVILTCAITLSMVMGFAGCGKKETTIKWATSFAGQEDEAKVLEVANEKLGKLLPGAKLEFIELNEKTWTQQMAAGEQIDIAWTGYSMDMYSEIKNGSYMPLDDLITEEDTPNLYKEWQEYKADYNTGTLDGKLYAIPNQQPILSQTPYLKIPESLMQYFDVDAFTKATYASPTTTREVYEVLDAFFEKVWEANAYDTDMVNDSIDIAKLYEFLAMRGYSSADLDGRVVYKTFSDKLELQNRFETEQYKLFIEYAAKWYEAGYISKKILVNTGAAGSRLPVLGAHGTGDFFSVNEKGIREVYDDEGYLEQYYVNIAPSDLSQKNCPQGALGAENTYLTIPYTCSNPKMAIKLIDLLRAPRGTEGNDLLNLLVYGFEKNSEEAKKYGTYHYTLEGEDLAKGNGYTTQPATSAPYGKPHWVIGNVFLTYRTPNILEGQVEYAKKYETEILPTLHKALLYGFMSNLDNYNTQLGNINSVVEEYNSRLYCGVDGANYTATYQAFLDKLNTAGYQEVFNEVSKQAEQFLSQK